jgi:hypothetical protein
MCKSDIIVAYNGMTFDILFKMKWLGEENMTFEINERVLDLCDMNLKILKQREKLNVMCINNYISDQKCASCKDAIICKTDK